MDKDVLEFLQGILIIIVIICAGIIAHHVAAAFGVVRSWYILLFAATGYILIEEKLNP